MIRFVRRLCSEIWGEPDWYKDHVRRMEASELRRKKMLEDIERIRKDLKHGR